MPGKKPPTFPRRHASRLAGPTTFGNARSLGARSLVVASSTARSFRTIVRVDVYADDAAMLLLGLRMRFSRCGKLSADVRPDSTHLRGAPRQ
jgi:hypothetical protein